MEKFDDFQEGYITAAQWTNDPSPGQGEYQPDFSIIPAQTLDQMKADCIAFCSQLSEELYSTIESDLSRSGTDFWLTRERTGAGFNDGDWPSPQDKELTDLAHSFGEANIVPCDLGFDDEGEV